MATNEVVRVGVGIMSICLLNELRRLLEKKKKRKKRQWWVKDWIRRRDERGASMNLLQEWSTEDKDMFKNHLRMSEELFEQLLAKVTPLIQKQNTTMRESLHPRLKLQVVLRYIAAGDCFRTLEALYRVPTCSISKFLPEVLAAIYEVLQHCIRVPTSTEEWAEVVKDYYTMWNFPNCCGAMDGKHIAIRCPENTGSYFFNYKKTFSTILFAIVDANYNFLYIDVGTNGRANDGLVFSKCTFNEALEKNWLNIPKNGVFVGDDAFPLRPYLLKPYSKKALTHEERVFNYRLSRARRVSENVFGILVSRFRVYEKAIPLQVETTEILIKATCALHNWLRQTCSTKAPYITEGLVDVELCEEGRILPGTWRQTKHDSVRNLTLVTSNNYTKEAAAVRDDYARQFCSTEIVPWQWKMI